MNAATTSRYTDAWLAEAAAGRHGRGYRNAAHTLVDLTPAQREAAIGEAMRIMNRTPVSFSEAVHHAAIAVRAGR